MYGDYHAPGYESGFFERGLNVIAWETFGDWQGDYAVVFQHFNEFGFLVIGYGSCSGCDQMEACETEEEYKDLISEHVDSISWGTADHVIARIKNIYDDNNWYRHDAGYKDSIQRLVQAVETARY